MNENKLDEVRDIPTHSVVFRMIEEAAVAMRREENFRSQSGRFPNVGERAEIQMAAFEEVRRLLRYDKVHGHYPDWETRRAIIQLATEKASEAFSGTEKKPKIPAYDKKPKKSRIFSDAEKVAQKQAGAEFAKSKFIAAKNCAYSLNDFSTKLNNNVLVVGGSGTGKTRTIVTPNLRQAVGSYIISDPKGNLYKKYKDYLINKGYKIWVADFTHPEKSMKYNPIEHLNSTQDILKLTNLIINDKKSQNSKVDPYWDRTAATYLAAIIGYMLETKYEPCDFKSILRLVRLGVRTDDDDCESSELAKMFAEWNKDHPDSWACEQFKYANTAPYKTFACTSTSLFSKFCYFDTEELRTMMSADEFDFPLLGCEKTALFVIVSDSDRTMDTLANLFFAHAMQELCEFADNECKDQRLPVPVRFILDDFATNCRIDEFPRIISSIRSRAVSVMLMLQSEAQLEEGYGADSSTIISNCDTYIYLGGNDVYTASQIGKRCNKPLAKVLNMPVGNCWVFHRGSEPTYTSVSDPEKYMEK